MEQSSAIALIRKGMINTHEPQIWVEAGAGEGLFTSALAHLLPDKSRIVAMDLDEEKLSAVTTRKEVELERMVADFTDWNPDLKFLDGVLVANALHFVRAQSDFLSRVNGSLKPGGIVIVVEYNMKDANNWVPFPVDFEKLVTLSRKAGFTLCEQLQQVPSRYNKGGIYSAVLKV